MQTLRLGMVLLFILSFFLSLFSILIGWVRLEAFHGIVIVFPFIFSISGFFELVVWIALLLGIILFLFWAGRKSVQKSEDALIPISRQCLKCASFLPINTDFCFICGEELQSHCSSEKKTRRAL